MSGPPNPMLQAALTHAKHGRPVFPLHTPTRSGCSCGKPECASIGKHPRTSNGVKDTSTDPEQIRQWWSRWPKANIGIATGMASGLAVLDIDGDRGRESFRTIKDNLPNAPVVRTGKGFHLYFQSNGVPIRNKVALLPGIDVRADGGYVVAPPSLHASGKKYLWLKGRTPKDVPLPDLPKEIPAKLAEKQQGTINSPAKAPEVLHEGERNDQLFRLASSLRAKGLETEEIEAALSKMNLRRCSPPLDAAEVHQIAGSAGRYESGSDGSQPSETLSVPEIITQAGLDDLTESASAEAVEQALRQLAANVNGADPLRRVLIQNAAVERLKEIGVRAATDVVKAALPKGGDDGGNQKGQMIAFADPEPWPDPVEGDRLLRELASTITRYVVIPKECAIAVALWTVHTYALEAADAAPILALLSPEKRCGKSRLLGVLKLLARKALASSNVTASVIFRAIDKWTPALLIDEMDSFLEARDEIRGILNSGHTRSAAFVLRSEKVGENFEPCVYSTWGSKACALIGKLPDTLLDRSIVIAMKRKNRNERVERFREKRATAELQPILRRALRWAQDNLEALKDADPEVPDGLNDRAADNWLPLIAVADQAGGPWPSIARKTALRLSGADNAEDDSVGVLLLSDLRGLFRERNTMFISSDTVVQELKELEERPWGEWKQGQPISKNQVASLLKKFGVYPDRDRVAGKQQRGYALKSLHDAFERYLPPLKAGASK